MSTTPDSPTVNRIEKDPLHGYELQEGYSPFYGLALFHRVATNLGVELKSMPEESRLKLFLHYLHAYDGLWPHWEEVLRALAPSNPRIVENVRATLNLV